MKESVAVAKEADAKKGVSPTRSDNSILRLRDEPEMQLGSLRGVIDIIRRDGGKPSVENIATELSSAHSAQRASVLLALQRTHGNRYVQRVVTGIQAKLKVGQPGDIYEQEADRVADEVMRMPEPGVQPKPISSLSQGPSCGDEDMEGELIQTRPIAEKITPLIQRQPEVEEEEPIKELDEEEWPIMTKGISSGTQQINSDLPVRLNRSKGGGQHLPEADRIFMESRFGVDFSSVKVHTDSNAGQMNKDLNAQAFTYGSDIYFNDGQFQPKTSQGKRLLAHELVHIVQQGNNNHIKSITNNSSLLSNKPQNGDELTRNIYPITHRTTSPIIAREPIPAGSLDDLGNIRYLSGRLRRLERSFERVHGFRVEAVGELIDNQGNKLFFTATYSGGGGDHAEQQLIRRFSRLPQERFPGGRLRIIVNQTPCSDICRGELREFARTRRLRLETFVLSSVDESGQMISPRTARGREVSLGRNRVAILVDDSSAEFRPSNMRSGLSRPRARGGRLSPAVRMVVTPLLLIVFAGASQQVFAQEARRVRDRLRQERESSHRIDPDGIGLGNMRDEINEVFNHHPLEVSSTTRNDLQVAVRNCMRHYYSPGGEGYDNFELGFRESVERQDPSWLEFVLFEWVEPNRQDIENARQLAASLRNNERTYLERAVAAEEAREVMGGQLENLARGLAILPRDMMTIYDSLRAISNRYSGYVNSLHFTLEALDEAYHLNRERFRRLDRELERIYEREH